MSKTVSTTDFRAQTAASAGEEIRLQGKLATPIIATYLAELLMWYVDHAIVGRLGATELGAVGLSGLLFWELIIVGVAILSIVGVIVGNAHGAGDVAMVGRGVRQGLWISVILSAPLMLISWFLMDLLVWTGQDPAVITLGEEYVRACVWVIPPESRVCRVAQLRGGGFTPVGYHRAGFYDSAGESGA